MAVFLCLLALTAPPARNKAPARVTVLYFDNNSGDAAFDPLGKGLADMMTTDLTGLPMVQVVEREKLQALLGELKLQRSKYFDAKTAQKIGKGLGAEFAVTGAFAALDPQIRIDVRVVRIASGEVVKADRVTGQKDKFFELQQQLVTSLAKGLATAMGRPEVKVSAQGGIDNLSTARAYGTSLEASDSGDLKQASTALQQVLKDAPSFKPAKERYMQILKALQAAKGKRSDAIKKADEELLAMVEPEIAYLWNGTKHPTASAWDLVALAVIRGEVYLKRIIDAIDAPQEYAPNIKEYLDGQERLARWELAQAKKDSKGRHYPKIWYSGYGVYAVDARESHGRDDLDLLGIKFGKAEPSERVAVHQIFQDMAALLMQGDAPFYSSLKFPKRVCFYTVDPTYRKRALSFIDEAQAGLAILGNVENDFREAEEISIERTRTYALYRLGEPEAAIAALQSMMDKYPKRPEFPALEAAVHAILDGKLPNGKPILAPCITP